MRTFIVAGTGVLWLVTLGLAACKEDASADADADADADSDSDSDSDVDECAPTAVWGSGFNVGGAVANWALNGMLDGDLDGVVDDAAADFSLEDVFCEGKRSLVIAVSDQDCGPCVEWYGAIAETSFYGDVLAANGGFLMFYSAGLGATPKSAQECYEYFSTHYGFEPGYYVNGPPSQFSFPYFPFMAVIDLDTGELLGKDNSATDYLTPDEILALVQAANAE
jgi:hypothetical protein